MTSCVWFAIEYADDVGSEPAEHKRSTSPGDIRGESISSLLFRKKKSRTNKNVFAFSAPIASDQIFIHRLGLAIISQNPSLSPVAAVHRKMFVQ